MKKVLLGVGAVVLLLVIGVGAMFGVTFSGLEPLPDPGADLPNGVRLVKDGYVSFYSLPADDGLVLVDCGNDPEGKALKAELERRKLTADAVKAIFLTHGHRDHIAGCHLFPTAKVYGFAADDKLARGDEAAHGPLTKMVKNAPPMVVAITDPLTDGQVVSVGSLQVKAFSVPGHTAGSASYLASGVLFMGDNATGEKGGATARGAPWMFSDDQAVNVASVKTLAAKLAAANEAVAVTAYSHSGPTDGLKALQNF